VQTASLEGHFPVDFIAISAGRFLRAKTDAIGGAIDFPYTRIRDFELSLGVVVQFADP